MNADRWTRVNELFLAVAELPVGDRTTRLDAACGDDGELRAEVQRLLAGDCQADDPFLAPASIVAQTSVTQTSAAREGRRDPHVGRQVGPYEIQRKLGEGGMGSVYLGVRTTDFTAQVAIKLIRRGMDSEIILHRFHDEMQFQAALGKHPYIAQMIDAGETEDGFPYFVMEYVDGERIDSWCDRQRLPVKRRLALFQEVCGAVQFAHQNTVIHRDLKPSNILVTADGRPVLIDFGIAKLLGDAPELPAAERTLTGMQVLTPEYASPEQIRRERLTTATDIYSLGMVLYELLTGRRPYRTTVRTPMELQRVVNESKPPRPSDVVLQTDTVEDQQGTTAMTPDKVAEARDMAPSRLSRTLRGDLDRVVLMALRKEPERRYSSAEQLSEDIHLYLSGLPVRAQRDTWAYRARKFTKRNWAALAASALVALSMAAGGAFSFTQWNRAEIEAARARQATTDESQAKEAAQTAQAQAETEAAKAEATVDFLLNDLIKAAHPSQLGYQVTVLEAVESSLDKIGKRFQGKPKIEAAVRLTAAKTLYDLGQVETAITEYKSSYEILVDKVGPDHPDALEAQLGLCRAYATADQRDNSLPLLRELVARSRNTLGDENELAIAAMAQLGEELQATGNYDEATELLLETIELQDQVYLPGDLNRMMAKRSLAICYLSQDKLKEAEAVILEMVEFCEEHAPPGSWDYILALAKLADVLSAQGRHEEALRYHRQAFEQISLVLPATHIHRISIQGDFAKCLWKLGRYEEAEPLLVNAYEKLCETRSPDDWLTERCLGFVRDFMYDCGKIDLAVEYHLESLRTRLRIGSRDQGESFVAAFAEYAEATQKHDRYPGDEALYDALTHYGVNELPKDHLHRAQFLGNLGWALLQKGEYARAEPLLMASYEERKVTQGVDHGDVQWLLEALVELYHKTERPDEASKFEAQLRGGESPL